MSCVQKLIIVFVKKLHGYLIFFFKTDLVLPKIMQFSCPNNVGKHDGHIMLMETIL